MHKTTIVKITKHKFVCHSFRKISKDILTIQNAEDQIVEKHVQKVGLKGVVFEKSCDKVDIDTEYGTSNKRCISLSLYPDEKIYITIIAIFCKFWW